MEGGTECGDPWRNPVNDSDLGTRCLSATRKLAKFSKGADFHTLVEVVERPQGGGTKVETFYLTAYHEDVLEQVFDAALT